MLTIDSRAYVLNELGTGKTRCILWAYDFMRQQGYARRLLVICPISALLRTWAREIMNEFPWLKYRVLHAPSRLTRLSRLNDNVDVYIINHDGVELILDELIARKDIDVVCADEIAVYRNGGADRTQRFRELASNKHWMWGLTGSPIPRAVTDVWGPCSAITPDTIPFFFNQFRAQLMYKDGPYRWEPKPGAEEQAVACMRPSVRFRLDEVTELPPQTHEYYEAALTPEQFTVYESMRKTAIVLYKDAKIDALNAGAVLSKLLQIATGYVYTREGRIITFNNAPRLQLTLDLIDSAIRKVIIFVPFKSAISALSIVMQKNKISHCIVSGDVSAAKRNVLFSKFQDTPEFKVLLAHPVCMAHSLTLTRATTTAWFGPTTSLEVFKQANARTYRLGQDEKTLVAMIGGTTVEERIYKLLGRNEKIQDRFLELIEDITERTYAQKGELANV